MDCYTWATLYNSTIPPHTHTPKAGDVCLLPLRGGDLNFYYSLPPQPKFGCVCPPLLALLLRAASILQPRVDWGVLPPLPAKTNGFGGYCLGWAGGLYQLYRLKRNGFWGSPPSPPTKSGECMPSASTGKGLKLLFPPSPPAKIWLCIPTTPCLRSSGRFEVAAWGGLGGSSTSAGCSCMILAVCLPRQQQKSDRKIHLHPIHNPHNIYFRVS